MTKYTIVKFNDRYAIKKTFFGMFEQYVDLTQENTYWMCWGKGRICFGNCLGTLERATYVYNLTQEGKEI